MLYINQQLSVEDPISFISYAKEDREKVLQYFRRLEKDSFRPWLDEHHIPPGSDWDRLIRNKIRQARFFLIFLSSNAVNKSGYIQREIKEALDVAEEMPDGKIFILSLIHI